MERPSMLASGLPGNRDEANRAGMTATTSSGRAVSTAEPVDAGCTVNNSTPKIRRATMSPGSMNVTRTVVLGVSGGALAVWLAAAATTAPRPAGPGALPRPSRPDLHGDEPNAETARLHERLRPTVAPLQSRAPCQSSAPGPPS